MSLKLLMFNFMFERWVYVYVDCVAQWETILRRFPSRLKIQIHICLSTSLIFFTCLEYTNSCSYLLEDVIYVSGRSCKNFTCRVEL